LGHSSGHEARDSGTLPGSQHGRVFAGRSSGGHRELGRSCSLLEHAGWGWSGRLRGRPLLRQLTG
jgi:hypothetical protein